MFDYFKRLARKQGISRSWIDENGLRVVSTFASNGKGEVRAYVQEFNGRELAHIRQFLRDKDGNARPTKKGIAVDVRELPKLAEAVSALLTIAEVRR